jgi:hypothetical protein
LEGELAFRYEVDGAEIVQVHPTHGRRSLIRADGHGQLVWVGEVAGSLLIFDRWSVMGYKDGSLRVLDPETLALRAYIDLDLDAVWLMGFDAGNRFVLCESRAGETTARAWRLSDWAEVDAGPVDEAGVESIEQQLTCVLDLPH